MIFGTGQLLPLIYLKNIELLKITKITNNYKKVHDQTLKKMYILFNLGLGF